MHRFVCLPLTCLQSTNTIHIHAINIAYNSFVTVNLLRTCFYCTRGGGSGFHQESPKGPLDLPRFCVNSRTSYVHYRCCSQTYILCCARNSTIIIHCRAVKNAQNRYQLILWFRFPYFTARKSWCTCLPRCKLRHITTCDLTHNYLLELPVRLLAKHDGLFQFFFQLNDAFFVVHVPVFQHFTTSALFNASHVTSVVVNTPWYVIDILTNICSVPLHQKCHGLVHCSVTSVYLSDICRIALGMTVAKTITNLLKYQNRFIMCNSPWLCNIIRHCKAE